MNRWDEIKGAALDVAHHMAQDPDRRDQLADDVITLVGLMIKAVGKGVAVDGESDLHDARTAEFPWDDGSFEPTPGLLAEAKAERADDERNAYTRYRTGEAMQAKADLVVNESRAADLGPRPNAEALRANWRPRCGICGMRGSHKLDCNDGLVEPECNGICLWAADIGVPEAGDVVAYTHPACPVHGNPTDSEICPACDSGICRCW